MSGILKIVPDVPIRLSVLGIQMGNPLAGLGRKWLTLGLLAIWFLASDSTPVGHAQTLGDGMAPASAERTPTTPEFDFEKDGGVVYRTWEAEPGGQPGAEPERLTLDVYQPIGEQTFPALLLVHGGSWRAGTKLNWFRHARKLVRAGFVVVAINYRHAPQHKFPAQIHDCQAAVRWMRQNAEEYQIDPDRIGGLGYSAGAQLVALLATSDADDGLQEPGLSPQDSQISTRIQAAAMGGAPCDFSWVEDEERTLVFWLGATRAENPEIYRQATPGTYVTVDDPPCYFFHGSRDWVVDISSAEILHELLLEQQIESEFQVWEGHGHFSLFSELDTMDPVIEFFQQQLGTASPHNNKDE